MLKLKAIAIALFIGTFSVSAQTTINCASAGSLKSKIGPVDLKTITSIVVTGPLDAEDISILKTMATPDSGKLVSIDLSRTELLAIGDEAFAECANLTHIVLPASISQIGNSAFGGCKNLTSISIPEKVTVLGDYAFAECEKLKSINIPQGVTNIPNGCFADCHSLETIKLPLHTKKLGKEAFARCLELSKIEIPAEVTSIGGAVFAGCQKLAFIKVDPNNKKYCSTAGGVLYSKDGKYILQYPAGKEGALYTIPNGVIRIGSYAFSGSKAISKITIPATCTSVGYGAFYECEKLSEIELPAQLTKVEPDLFYGCKSLTQIRIPDEVTSIGSNSFFGCSSLKSVSLPAKVTKLGKQSFQGCSSLENISLPDGITEIPQSCFAFCGNLKELKLPNTVTDIAETAFAADSSLSSIALPKSIVSIGGGAFASCNNLGKVMLPNGLRTMGYATFANCPKLEAVVIPASVDSIGISSFVGCDGLNEIKVESTNPPKANILAFYNLTDTIMLKVPEGKEDAYHNALGWKEFKHINNKTYEIVREETVTDISDQLAIAGGNLEECFMVYSSLNSEIRAAKIVEDNNIYLENEVEEKARFSDITNYLKNAVRYPVHAKGRQGTVTIAFVVEKNGTLSHLKVKQSQGNELDAEAVATVFAMPKWEPAKKDGKTVRSQTELKINIRKQ